MFAACWLALALCLPLTRAMPSKYDQQRAAKTPPHVSLKALRKAAGLTHEQVCQAVADATEGRTTLTRGGLSAIESGLRGASFDMLRALELAYGLDPGDIDTDYQPRMWREAVPA